MSVNGISLWGEPESDRGHTGPQKHPSKALWSGGWRPASVSCQAPPVYEPSPSSDPQQTTPPHLASLDSSRNEPVRNLVLHSIDLARYHDTVAKIVPGSVNQDGDPITTVPPIPTRFWPSSSRGRWRGPVAGDSKNTGSLSKTELDVKSCNLLRRRSVATLCVLAGYETASSRTLDCLTDLLEDFLSRCCRLLRVNLDQHGRETNIDMGVERTLHQMGIGGKAALKDYWEQLSKNCNKLMQDAEQLAEEKKWELSGQGGGSGDRKELGALSLKGIKKPLSDYHIPSPWVTVTPEFGTEDMQLGVEAGLDGLPARTPDLANMAFLQLDPGQGLDEGDSLGGFAWEPPPRKKPRGNSLTGDYT